MSKENKKLAKGGIVSGPTPGLIGKYSFFQLKGKVISPLDKLKKMIMDQKRIEIVEDLLDEDFRHAVIVKYIEDLGVDISKMEMNILESVFDLLELPTDEELPDWRDHLYDYKWNLLEQINFPDVPGIMERCSDKLCNLSSEYLEWLIDRKKSLKDE